MKITILLLLAFVPLVSAEEKPQAMDRLETTNGKVYEKVTIRKVDPDGLSIMHESGTAKIPFEKLPPAMQEAYGFDASKAEEHRQAQAEKDRQNEAAMLAEEAAVAKAAEKNASKKVDKEQVETIRKEGINVWLKIQQNPGGSYCLCRWGLVSKSPIKKVVGLSNQVVGYEPVDDEESDTTIAVHGVGHLADGETWRGTVYPCGKLTYETVMSANRTVRRYATTPEEAQKILSGER